MESNIGPTNESKPTFSAGFPFCFTQTESTSADRLNQVWLVPGSRRPAGQIWSLMRRDGCFYWGGEGADANEA